MGLKGGSVRAEGDAEDLERKLGLLESVTAISMRSLKIRNWHEN